MFSQDPAFWREASGNRFYDDFELDFGGVLGAKLAHKSPFGRPGRRAQARADEVYLDERLWTRKSVLSALRMAKFSTDRTIKEYAEKIWNVEAKAFLPQHVKERLKVGRK